MAQIWTNPSLQRSVLQPKKIDVSVKNYLNLSLSSFKQSEETIKTVNVFPNTEYFIKFYDPDIGGIRSITALVTDVWEDDQPTIKAKYHDNPIAVNPSDCKSCKRKNCPQRNKSQKSQNCNCLNPPTTGNTEYLESKVVFIPVCNIIDIEYKDVQEDPKENNMPKGGTKVMILGISATAVKAIVIHLDFFDDCLEEAVRYVDLAVGGVYDIVYVSPREGHTVYETRGRLESIEEIDYIPCHPGKGYVRENVGMNGCVCQEENDTPTKTDFLKSPPARPIKLVFDTSETFEGRYEAIMLSDIRDCKMAYAPDGTTGEVEDNACCDTCVYRTFDCDIHTCGHHKPSPGKKPNNYKIGEYKVVVHGDHVCIKNKTEETSVSMKELLKFYLGIE